jgi:hypothetical protein
LTVCLLLLVQYLLGMAVNLYVALPGRHPGAGAPDYFTGAAAIVGAGFNGASFVDYGHAFSSMIMAGLWALALACYLAGTLLTARRLLAGPGPAGRVTSSGP